jgi:hypothetical protein
LTSTSNLCRRGKAGTNVEKRVKFFVLSDRAGSINIEKENKQNPLQMLQ